MRRPHIGLLTKSKFMSCLYCSLKDFVKIHFRVQLEKSRTDPIIYFVEH
uniref:Uncharacterized protein n=1 Tax=Rhizophora mucronata TaxID=61149 RepID=A0A2P2NQF0_RHIMU